MYSATRMESQLCKPLLVTPVPPVMAFFAFRTISPQFLSEQITRYFSDVLDNTDETLGEPTLP